jgi:hypothetical protein
MRPATSAEGSSVTSEKVRFMISKDFLAAVGAVTVAFAHLENFLESAIWMVLLGNKLEAAAAGRIVTGHLSFSRKLDLYQSLVRLHPGHRDAELGKLVTTLNKMEEERNITIHSIWAASTDDQKLMRIKTSARGLLTFKEISVDDLHENCGRRSSQLPPGLA